MTGDQAEAGGLDGLGQRSVVGQWMVLAQRGELASLQDIHGAEPGGFSSTKCVGPDNSSAAPRARKYRPFEPISTYPQNSAPVTQRCQRRAAISAFCLRSAGKA